MIFFNWAGEWNWEEMETIEYDLELVLISNHMCCKIKNPKDIRKVEGLSFGFWKENKTFDEVQVKLISAFESTKFNIYESSTTGDKIMFPAARKDGGYNNYVIKVSEEIHLENDPNYPCIDYKSPGEYGECLEQEYLKELFKFGNCTPPWFTKNKNLWCRGKPEFDSEEKEKGYRSFIYKMTQVGKDPPKKCLVPCRRTKYSINNYGHVSDKRVSSVSLAFDRVVEKTLTELQINSRTLITRFGGIIGVGKNLMWIIILGFSYVGFFANKAKKKRDGDKATEIRELKV